MGRELDCLEEDEAMVLSLPSTCCISRMSAFRTSSAAVEEAPSARLQQPTRFRFQEKPCEGVVRLRLARVRDAAAAPPSEARWVKS